MPETCVPENHCGTAFPGWLRTQKHPNFGDGTVESTVCFSGPNSCCKMSTEIKVKNCGEYYIYNLKAPPTTEVVCPRYCGTGEGGIFVFILEINLSHMFHLHPIKVER